MSSKLKYHQNRNVTKNEMSPQLKSNQNWNVTNTEMSPKLKCHQNWNIAKTEKSSKLKGFRFYVLLLMSTVYWLPLKDFCKFIFCQSISFWFIHFFEFFLKVNFKYKKKRVEYHFSCSSSPMTKMLPILKCYQITKCHQNQNPRGRPWLPWSCFSNFHNFI